MTKRLLLAVALVSALATAAGATQGRVAIVYNSGLAQTNDPIGSGSIKDIQQRNIRMLLDVLDQGGVRYFMLPGKQAKIEQLRRGIISRGSQVDTVAGVIHAGFWGAGTAATFAQTQYHGDSLTRVTTNSTVSGVDVPHLFLIDNTAQLSTISLTSFLGDDAGAAATRCTTGVTGDKTNPFEDPASYWYADKSIRFTNHPYSAGWTLNSTTPAGGIRPILGLSTHGLAIAQYDLKNAGVNRNAAWPDSMPFLAGASAETLVVWERLWNIATIPTAKPMVFCDWFGAGAMNDSTGSSYGFPFCEGNAAILMVGLARFDSLCGGIFKRPIQGAITVQSALSRGLRRWNRGIAPGDTATFYGALDSLKAWGVPVTFYANVDSADTYARDVIKLKEVSQARFSPQVWDGVADTTRGSTWVAQSSTNTGLPRDIFGHWTARAIYGDGTGTGSDSSAWAQLKSAKARRDSVFGAGRASRSIRAPLDDWSPKLKTAAGSVDWADSLMWMLAESNIGALVVNGRSIDLGRDFGLPSAFVRQRTYRPTIGTKSINILAHNGSMLGGGAGQWFTFDDSTAFAEEAKYHGRVLVDIARANAGIFYLSQYRDYDVFRYDDAGTGSNWRAYAGIRFEREDMFPMQHPAHGSIVSLSCADLSGDPTNPARSGLWVIKSLWNTSRIVNAMAGRNLFQLTYPENVRP